MDILSWSIRIIIGLFIGTIIGMTGIGGGALAQPALIHVIGIAPVPAVGTGLLYAMVTKVVGTVSHFRLKTIRVRLAFYFLVGSIPCIWLTSHLINQIFRDFDSSMVNASVQFAIAISLMATAVVLIVRMLFSSDKQTGTGVERTYLEGNRSPLPFRRKVTAALAGAIIGIIMGATSVGGGAFIVPALIILLNISASQAAGTSIAISVVLAALGGTVYLMNENVQLLTVVLMSIGSLPGVLLGSRLSVKIPDKILRNIVILMVAGSGLSLLFERS